MMKSTHKIFSKPKGGSKMRKQLAWIVVPVLLLSLFGCKPKEQAFEVPVEYHKLDNGLKVVLSPDPTAPIVTVAVYYNIGFRIEPRDRTGFAHLFEHMMFQGSQNMGKMEFIRLIEGMGGVLNGSTRFDFTNYFEIVPSHKLETVLWAEADRMKGLDITQENLTNQQGVVINEVNNAVHNAPYGGFPWLDMPQYANENWFNAHNFYGDIDDVAAATLEDVQAFFDTYYTPNNAALVVAGDFEPAEALEMIEKYFGDIEAVERPELPDISEPVQEKEKRFSKDDRLANRPALAERNTPEYFAMGLINEILLQGEDSLLYQALVKQEGLTGSVDGGINMLGNMYNYNGPMLITAYLFYDDISATETIMSAVDAVIEEIRTQLVAQDVLDRALVKLRSGLYDTLGGFFGFGRADLMASFALFDDQPERINSLEAQFESVTPELIMKTAAEYLSSNNRTLLTIVPQNTGQ